MQLLYYRKDLFESTVLRRLYQEKYKCDLQPPANFTEFNRIAEFFTKKKNPNSPVDYGTSLTLGSFGVAGSEFMARYLETHKNLYDEDGKVRLNSPEGNLAMQQLIELKEMAPTHSNTWWTDTAEDFASGRLAMAILYSNYASDLIREGSNISELIGCTLVPGQNPILGGASLGISSTRRLLLISSSGCAAKPYPPHPRCSEASPPARQLIRTMNWSIATPGWIWQARVSPLPTADASPRRTAAPSTSVSS